MDQLDSQTQEFFEKGGEVEIDETHEPEIKNAEADGDAQADASDTGSDPKPEDRDRGNLGAALHEAREEIRQLKARNEQREREFNEKWQSAESKLQAFLAQANQPRQQQEEPISFEEDPVAFLKRENDKLRQQVEQVTGTVQDTQRQTAEQQKFNTFVTHVQTLREQFKAATPDYMDAYKHVRDLKVAELSAAGLSPEQAEQAADRWEFSFAAASLQKNGNPAEAIYGLASKLGYKKTAKSDDKLDTLRKGREVSKTVSGGREEVGFNLETLSAKSDAEISELAADPKFWKRLERAA